MITTEIIWRAVNAYDESKGGSHYEDMRDALTAVLPLIGEACAKMVQDKGMEGYDFHECEHIAAAIRAATAPTK